MFNNYHSPPENRAVYEIMWKNMAQPPGHGWQYNAAHALFMLKSKATNTHSEYVTLIALPL
jgi:hypothetical protein